MTLDEYADGMEKNRDVWMDGFEKLNHRPGLISELLKLGVLNSPSPSEGVAKRLNICYNG